MLIEHVADDVVAWAPAKVNLYLEVLSRRPDGYHDIETVMAAVNLFDTLAFKEDASGEIVLHCDHPGLSTGEDNLVMRAARLLRHHAGGTRGARIRLTKRIPLAAGLAGGSSDAAATLLGLDRLWRLGLGSEELAGLAAQLGSDVAFFLAGSAAWCTGRGERVEPLALGARLFLVLYCPPAGLATADVYRGVTVPAEPRRGDAIRQALMKGAIEKVGGLLFNRLQPAAERLCPAVAVGRERLERLRPAGLLMSGSGSSLFALCRGPQEALRIADRLRETAAGDGARVFLVRICR